MSKNKNQKNFLVELGRRGVFQAVGIYVAVAWGSIEILITSSDRFGWPSWLGDIALILFLTALPFVVLLSWAFDLSGSGLKRMEAGSLTGKVLIAATLTLVLGLSASWFVLRNGATSVPGTAIQGIDGRPVIAIMPFQDFIESANSKVLSLAFTDELINRVNAHPDLIALDLHTVTRPGLEQSGHDAITADYFVQGSLKTAQVGIKLQVRMVDRGGAVKWEFDAVRDYQDPTEARNAQEYLAANIATGLGKSLTGIDYCQPSKNIEASRIYYEALNRFAQRGAENVATAAILLEQAIELDPDYARALNLLGAVYMRFQMHVSKDPSQYGMNEDELQDFIESEPYLPLLKHALALCPNLGSAYVSLELSAPVRHYSADLVDFLLEGLRRDPADTDLMDWAAYTYLEMGHLESALKMASEFYQRDPLNPRSGHVLALILRVMGNSDRALGLEKKAVEAGYEGQGKNLIFAYDRYVTGDIDTLVSSLDHDFIAGPDTLSIDPRLLVAASMDAPGHAKLVKQVEAYVADTTDPRDLFTLVGSRGSMPWVFELNDPELAWKTLQKFVEITHEGVSPYGFWVKRWRHWFGNQRLVELLKSWTPDYEIFWNRHGAPDGCEWDGETLICAWAESL